MPTQSRGRGVAACSALYKQRELWRVLLLERVFDVYIHTRFDAAFNSPVSLRVLRGHTLYVARSTWFLDNPSVHGQVSNQSEFQPASAAVVYTNLLRAAPCAVTSM